MFFLMRKSEMRLKSARVRPQWRDRHLGWTAQVNRAPPTHVVDVLGGGGGGAGGGADDGGGAAVRHVLVVPRRLHLHVAALRVFAEGGRVVDGGVRVFAVQGAGAGQGALHVVCKDPEHRRHKTDRYVVTEVK